MEILGSRALNKYGTAKRTYLSTHSLRVKNNGHEFDYYAVARGESLTPPAEKRPDAVVIVAVLDNPGEERRLVLCNEFRPAIGCREISFPAGLIDHEDWADGADYRTAAIRSSVRELKEEVGLIFEPKTISPPHLYSSAGMTDESVIVVMGKATGVPECGGQEGGEDIIPILLPHRELGILCTNHQERFGKVCWPFLWALNLTGFDAI